MEDNNNGYSAEGRKLRPRKKVSFEGGDRKPSGDYGHRNYGERRSYSESGERRSYGERSENSERRPYGGGERRSYGERGSNYDLSS